MPFVPMDMRHPCEISHLKDSVIDSVDFACKLLLCLWRLLLISSPSFEDIMLLILISSSQPLRLYLIITTVLLCFLRLHSDISIPINDAIL